MRVFVTGSTGFIGAHLVRELTRREHRVVALVRSPEKARPLADHLERTVTGDLDSVAALSEGVAGCDAVIHVAGCLAGIRYEHYERVNVRGTRRVLEAAAKGGLERFVHVSSLAAAGPSPAAADGTVRPLREADPPAPISLYGRSKLESERLVRSFSERFPVSIVRPPSVYGPGDRATLLFFKMVRGGWVWLPGDAAIPVSIVHVDDLVRGIVDALEGGREREECYYLCSEHTPTLRSVLEGIAAAYARDVRIVRLPRAVVLPIALLAEGWSALRGRPSFLNRDKLRELGARGWWCSPEQARERLGWEARIPLEEGLATTASWYAEQGWIRAPAR